jgi:hypothetical protein
LVAGSVIGMPWPCAVSARHGSRDPLVQWEQQRKKTAEHKTERREQLDIEGAEMRDAKKSAQDSRQSQTQGEIGNPNPQTDRWGLW